MTLLLLVLAFVSNTNIAAIFLNIDGLVQERRNSSALAMEELRLSCIKPLY